MVTDDSFYMSLALKEAWKYQALTYPNPPVGALILDKNNSILSIEAHKEAGREHAELNAIIKAFTVLTKDEKIEDFSNPNEKYNYLLKNHNNIFKDFTIFVTLEPCMHQGKTPPCSLLLLELGFKRVVIATTDPNKNAGGGVEFLRKNKITVKTGVLKKEADILIEPFKKWQKNKPFVFFKLAHTQNGIIKGGIISSFDSRKLVHRIRSKIDLLVIGGNTVRSDRPTLDCRLITNEYAPDILIYSRKKDFDKNIPLFKVKNRKVFIKSDLEKIKSYKHIMIEGGEGMLKESLGKVDWFLSFISPAMRENENIKCDFNLKRLNISLINDDIIVWNKIINKF